MNLKKSCCSQQDSTSESNSVKESRTLILKRDVEINRKIFDKQSLDLMFPNDEYKRFNIKKSISSSLAKCIVRKKCVKNQLYNRLPSIQWLKSYKIKFLFSDLIAGLVVGILHIPFGLALSNLATLLPVYGLYVSFFPGLI